MISDVSKMFNNKCSQPAQELKKTGANEADMEVRVQSYFVFQNLLLLVVYFLLFCSS